MHTRKFSKIFNEQKPLVGMIHIQALPGTPGNQLSVAEIIQQAVAEVGVLQKSGIQAIMLENMHDTPYLKRRVGPEIVAAFTAVATAVRAVVELPLGIQILAGANCEALAVAQAAGLQFIRSEGFVFGHLADEGFMESDAAELLRYRKMIGAEEIQVYTDMKKKHSSHALTADVSLVDTVEAAEFFRSDGVIITGTHTGKPVDTKDLSVVYRSAAVPVMVGSGVTPENLSKIWDHADAFIVGSYFKTDGDWRKDPDPRRLKALVEARRALV